MRASEAQTLASTLGTCTPFFILPILFLINNHSRSARHLQSDHLTSEIHGLTQSSLLVKMRTIYFRPFFQTVVCDQLQNY